VAIGGAAAVRRAKRTQGDTTREWRKPLRLTTWKGGKTEGEGVNQMKRGRKGTEVFPGAQKGSEDEWAKGGRSGIF